MSVAKLLKRVQLFTTLNASELEQIAAICEEKQAEPDELLIQQNTTGTGMYIIADGAAEVFIEGMDNARSLVVLGKGQVIGEMALIDQGYRSASVRATKKGATLYRIANENFNNLCHQNNHIGFVVMRNLAIDLAFKLRHRNLTEL
ncbi:MAG: cyclic nucleotide-binding domain-containing protein [Ardenticatenaceae bacterium]|nr:cyclic nucleotide-binding domain-containing protein [Ardenticatenaceae bacterium]